VWRRPIAGGFSPGGGPTRRLVAVALWAALVALSYAFGLA
jgi:hypothetical protein